jgi:WD40 repeat protein
VTALAFLPNSKDLLSADDQGRINLWLESSGENKVAHDWQFPGAIHALAVDREGKRFATGNSNGTAAILQLPTAK